MAAAAAAAATAITLAKASMQIQRNQTVYVLLLVLYNCRLYSEADMFLCIATVPYIHYNLKDTKKH